MTRRFLIAAGLIFTSALAAISCKGPQQEEPQDDPVVAPAATVEVNALDRTSVTFTISSDFPGDYAWAIVSGTDKVASAEALFRLRSDSTRSCSRATDARSPSRTSTARL